jgi:hypothetical protein
MDWLAVLPEVLTKKIENRAPLLSTGSYFGATGASLTITGHTFGAGTLTPLFSPRFMLSNPK